jgi:hypothetical protein
MCRVRYFPVVVNRQSELLISCGDIYVAANHHTSSLLTTTVCGPLLLQLGAAPWHHPAHCTPPPSRGGGGSRAVRQPRRSLTPPSERFTSPPLHASPSPGVDGHSAGAVQEPSPRPPASPATGVAGRACRLVGPHLPGNHTVTNPGSSWASVVRDGARAYHKPAVSRQDFLALYERCIDSGLRARIVFRHQAGSREVLISCRLCAPPPETCAPANASRRRRRRNCAPASAAAYTVQPTVPDAPLHTATTQPSPPPPEVTSPATIASPPAKRTRKAARRRCEAELLRDNDSDDDDVLQLSPISQGRPAPFPTTSPSPSTTIGNRNASTIDNAFSPTSSPLQPVLTVEPEGSPAPPPAPLTTTSSPLQPDPPATSPPCAQAPIDTTNETSDAVQPSTPPSEVPNIPPAPPFSKYLPTCTFKVICRFCFRDDHDICYRQCPTCYKKRGAKTISDGDL